MKLTTGILILGMAAGSAWAQNPDIIENTRNTMKAIQQKKEIDSNAALAASQGQSAKPSPKPSPSSSSNKTTFEVSPGPGKGTNPAAAHPAQQKPAVAGVKPVSVTAKPAAAAQKPVVQKATSSKAAFEHITAKPGKAPVEKRSAAKSKSAQPKQPKEPKQQVAVEDKKNPADPKKEKARVINVSGKRDPFVSPVVSRSMTGSGCSTGKRCLAIDQIALRGVVKSDNGMIAVVVNALDKAYFLRENDPVFNGYVVKITGDSIIFKETLQDKLGKSFTREVTKKINTPAV